MRGKKFGGYVVHLLKCPLNLRPKLPIDKCICREGNNA